MAPDQTHNLLREPHLIAGADIAARYANRLLVLLGSDAAPRGAADHPALAWRRAGLMEVTGRPDGPGLQCPAPLAAVADGAMMALRALAPRTAMLPESGAMLLGERARLMTLARGGRRSANGSCCLLEARDGRIALNLARADDWDLMPILLGRENVADWDGVAREVARHSCADLLELGIELGLPIAHDAPQAAVAPFSFAAQGPARRAGVARPLVLDFSALWAGPLAASLLAMLGADVVKVESAHRPDGARYGHPGFYALMNGGKRSVALNFRDADQLGRLLSLLDQADIVIEGSRPRALRRLGIDRNAVVARGGIWVSITGHDDDDRVGFGDDAAVAAGLSGLMASAWGEPLFAGDAIADPLTGLHAALAAWAKWCEGHGGLIKLSLAGTTAFAMQADVTASETLEVWQHMGSRDELPYYPLRGATERAPASGADNSDLLGL